VSGPDDFEIVIAGKLTSTAITALAGFTFVGFIHGQSHLVAHMPDQTRLHDALIVLADMEVDLVSISRMPGLMN